MFLFVLCDPRNSVFNLRWRHQSRKSDCVSGLLSTAYAAGNVQLTGFSFPGTYSAQRSSLHHRIYPMYSLGATCCFSLNSVHVTTWTHFSRIRRVHLHANMRTAALEACTAYASESFCFRANGWSHARSMGLLK